MIISQNNHILELLKIVFSLFIKELTTINNNANGGDLTAKQCFCPDTIIVYYEGLLDITLTLTSAGRVSLVYFK
jgi:hypothetical protein